MSQCRDTDVIDLMLDWERALGELTEWEMLLYGMHYGEGWTLREIGGVVGLTGERCGQILRGARAKMRPFVCEALV